MTYLRRNEHGFAAASALVAVLLFSSLGFVLMSLTFTTVRDGTRTNAAAEARSITRAGLDIAAGLLEGSDSVTVLDTLVTGSPWQLNPATGGLDACTAAFGDRCLTYNVTVTDTGANDLVEIDATVATNCDAGGCDATITIRDTWRERSLLDFVLHSDHESLEGVGCDVAATSLPATCQQAAWNSVLPSAGPEATINPGMIVAWAAPTGTPTPPGWVLADGSTLSSAAEPALFNTIGTTWGGNPTNFAVPDLAGRTPLGADPAAAGYDNVGDTGGATEVTLTVAELPAHAHAGTSHTHTLGAHNHAASSHTHAASTSTNGNHTHNIGWQGAPGGSFNAYVINGFGNASLDGNGFVNPAGTHSHSVSVSSAGGTVTAAEPSISTVSGTQTTSTGGTDPHPNLQPYLTIQWLIAVDPGAAFLPGMMAPTIDTGTEPAGWVEADGRTLDQATYPDLYAVIAGTYGDDATTFNVPNTAGRVLTGVDPTSTEFTNVGDTGGTPTVALSEAQMPAHSHSIGAHTHTGGSHSHTVGSHSHTASTGSAGAHTHQMGWDGSAAGTQNRVDVWNYGRVPNGANFLQSTGNHTHTVTLSASSGTLSSGSGTVSAAPAADTGSTGVGDAHTNLGPYIALRWLIAVDPAPTFAPGMVMHRADNLAGNPTGWITADGTDQSRITNDLLYATVGDTYGAGDGLTTFGIPDLTGRHVAGHDLTNVDFDVIGETGGTAGVALSVDELPAHTHTQPAHSHTDTGHTHPVTWAAHSATTSGAGSHSHLSGWNGSPAGSGNAFTVSSYGNKAQSGANTTSGAGNHAHSVSVNAATATIGNSAAVDLDPTTPAIETAGNDEAHLNLNPYATVRYMIATAPSAADTPLDRIDQVFGPIHTNDDYLLLCGTPAFSDVFVAGAGPAPFWQPAAGPNCAASSPTIEPGGGGFQTAEPLVLPDTDEWLAVAQNLPGAVTYTGDTTIEFTGTSYTVTTSAGTQTGVSFPPAGVINVTAGIVEVSGVVDGAVSIVANDSVIVTDDLTYACSSPSTATLPIGCDDVLGLNSAAGIVIEYGTTIPGPDRTVHAAIAAVNGSVFVDRWSTSPIPVGQNPPTLYLAGSIVAEHRGVYGGYDAPTGELRSGYRKYFAYDDRFRQIQPPFFVSPAGTRWARIDSNDLATGTLGP